LSLVAAAFVMIFVALVVAVAVEEIGVVDSALFIFHAF
jgi:hypothetical protein